MSRMTLLLLVFNFMKIQKLSVYHRIAMLTLKVLVVTIDALGHFETG